MAYQALYRKYRPLTFSDVCGQDNIVRALTGAIRSENVGHAYLFCGTRGTGKTTLAKILSRALNCEHPVDGEPCNSCPTCESILRGASLSVFEIDAASNSGVDNVRQIIEEVQYPPQGGRKKVYIIDEAHNLSPAAFNALLKTLEEPPEYAVFILCTTDPGRILQTITSRCQRFDFRHIPISIISDRLSEICGKESIDAEESAIRYIASAGDGSMRDALSLLDECRAFGDGKHITYDEALQALGAVDTGVFGEFLRAMRSSDIPGAMDVIARITAEGRETGKFVNDFTWYLRNMMLIKVSQGDVSGLDEILGISSENLRKIREDANDTELSLIIRYIRAFAALSGRIRYEAQKRVLLECEVITLMTEDKGTGDPDARKPDVSAPVTKGSDVVKTEAVKEEALGPEAPKAETEEDDRPEPLKVVPDSKDLPTSEASAEPVKPTAADNPLTVLIDEWESVIATDDDPLERMALKNTELRVNGDSVTLIPLSGLYIERLRRELDHIRAMFEKYVGRSLEVTVQDGASEKKDTVRPVKKKSDLEDFFGVPVEEED